MKLPATSSRVSTRSCAEARPPSPFIPVANYRVFWRRRIKYSKQFCFEPSAFSLELLLPALHSMPIRQPQALNLTFSSSILPALSLQLLCLQPKVTCRGVARRAKPEALLQRPQALHLTFPPSHLLNFYLATFSSSQLLSCHLLIFSTSILPPSHLLLLPYAPCPLPCATTRCEPVHIPQYPASYLWSGRDQIQPKPF
jgi:hypothetical protein